MEQFQHSIGAILNRRKSPCGTGFLAGSHTLLTCVHVVVSAGGPQEPLFVQFLGSEEVLPIQLTPNGWHPDLDVACLHVDNPPAASTPFPLAQADPHGKHPFLTIGFPSLGDYRGVHDQGVIDGVVVKENGRSMLQLDSKNITHGFSGAPIFDTWQHAVVGMVVEVAKPPHQGHKLRDAAFALPIEAIWDAMPDLRPPQTRENPFFYGGRINDPNHFFGRQQLLRTIKNDLQKHTNVSLVGVPQIGKSSLLYYLFQTRADWLPDTKIAYLDLQRVWDQDDFFEEVLAALGHKGSSYRELKRALLNEDAILLLDEVERLAEPDFSPRLHDLLRAIGQEELFAMCFASQKPLVELFPPKDDDVSPIHNIFTERQVLPFTESEARQFLTLRLAHTPVHFTPTDTHRMLTESANHPAQLQKLARALYDEYIR